ncbi:hypothetical protein TRP8649_01216 [Pelagimonas phthalicica]|uniref:Uncharacterized protein n=1 Tax=Pelagimonas phthalicica TaxID=1037362 RepID=A0A238JA86_9RHOB|nr:hypothetical protein CLV87_0856 [Pelagimonas phthalicica]SMX27114.1 hypothetical protein TRP8649_01216 [Pelagimonas phthalicica]
MTAELTYLTFRVPQTDRIEAILGAQAYESLKGHLTTFGASQ